jgi:hypothetical protein
MVRALAAQRDIFASLAGFSGSAFDIGAPGSISRVHGDCQPQSPSRSAC